MRSRGRTGKPARQLRSDWTDAWEQPDGPDPLPMPLQSMISEPALRRVDAAAAGGHAGATRLATYFVGQGVGLLHTVEAGGPGRSGVHGGLRPGGRGPLASGHRVGRRRGCPVGQKFACLNRQGPGRGEPNFAS